LRLLEKNECLRQDETRRRTTFGVGNAACVADERLRTQPVCA
jgi:hypothetical protein